MVERGVLDERIHEARRRVIWNLVLSQAAVACSTAAVGAVVLLIVGTQILDWPWLVFLFLGSPLYGLVRLRRRLPSPYAVAQKVDRLLNLEDLLSTAYFFRSQTPREPGGVVDAQGRRAEEAARRVDVRRALPLVVPRGLQATALLGVAVAGLFVARYMITRSLDLRAPIVQAAAFDVFRSIPREKEKARQSRNTPRPNELPPIPAVALEGAEGRRAAATGAAGQQGETVYSPSDSRASLPQPEEVTVPGIEGSEQGESTGADPAPSNSDSAPRGRQAPRQPPGGENSSLMNKLRDAMADLLAKLKIQPPAGLPRESSGEQGTNQAGTQKQNPGQGDAGAERQQADTGGGDESADEQGEGNSPSARGKSGERASGQQASGQEKSGMGKEEGDKSLREAEQLAAMGKLSEIIGKRTENMTGEVMVEVKSGGRQELKTPYSQRNATHAESGGEIHRDEVPLIFQDYVQRYFEEIRKSPQREPTAGR